MPTNTTDGLTVSAEEQRYLRRTFRRFALPYLVVLVAFVWWMSSSQETGVDPESVSALEAQVAELQASLAAVTQEVAAADARAAEAVALADDLEAKQGKTSSDEVARLKRDLRRSAARISALEKKLGDESVALRFDALRDRIAGVEKQLSKRVTPASPAPRPEPDLFRP